jgi:hypothetical protein
MLGLLACVFIRLCMELSMQNTIFRFVYLKILVILCIEGLWYVKVTHVLWLVVWSLTVPGVFSFCIMCLI